MLKTLTRMNASTCVMLQRDCSDHSLKHDTYYSRSQNPACERIVDQLRDHAVGPTAMFLLSQGMRSCTNHCNAPSVACLGVMQMITKPCRYVDVHYCGGCRTDCSCHLDGPWGSKSGQREYISAYLGLDECFEDVLRQLAFGPEDVSSMGPG